MRQTYIYALICPISGQPRYVGKTQVLDQRLDGHIKKARSGETKSHAANWIRSLLAKGIQPTIEVIAEVPSGEAWQDWESRFIREYREAGYNLTNATSGGDGFHDIPAESIALRSARAQKTKRENPQIGIRQRERAAATNALPEVKARKAKAARETWSRGRGKYLAVFNTPEALAKRARATARRYHDEQARLAHGIKMAQVCSTPEARAAQSARSFAAHANPEMASRRRQALKAAYQRPEVRARNEAQRLAMAADPIVKQKKSVASKKAWAENRDGMLTALHDPAAKAKHHASIMKALEDPEVRARRYAARWTPEARAKQAAEIAGRRDAMRSHSPETIAKRNASIKAAWARRKAAAAVKET